MTRKLNVLGISFEDCLPFYGCYGDKIARTPAVDRLASEGCIYPNAFSTAPICAPARAAVITGMYPTSIGAHPMRTSRGEAYDAPAPHYVKCLGEYFRREGYYCSNNVKTDYQFEPPFAAWDDCSSNAHWRNRPDQSVPFFAVFNPEYTHESGMWEEKRAWPFNYVLPNLKETTDPGSVEVPPYFPDAPRVRRSIAKNTAISLFATRSWESCSRTLKKMAWLTTPLSCTGAITGRCPGESASPMIRGYAHR